MVASIRCPHCADLFEVPPSFLGRDVTCLTCSKPFVAPKKSDVTAAQPPPAPPKPAPPPPPTAKPRTNVTPPTARPRSTPQPPQPRRVQRPPSSASPPSKSGNAVLWLALGILALLMLGGCVVGMIAFAVLGFRASSPNPVAYAPAPVVSPAWNQPPFGPDMGIPKQAMPPIDVPKMPDFGPGVGKAPDFGPGIGKLPDNPPGFAKEPDPRLDVPPDRPAPPDMPRPRQPPAVLVPSFVSDGNVNEFVAGTFASRDIFVSLTGDGRLRRFVQPNLAFKGQCQLEKIGSLIAVDEAKGRLYLAAAAEVAFTATLRPASLRGKPPDLSGTGDLLVYDVRAFLERGEPDNAVSAKPGSTAKSYLRVRPIATLPLNAKVTYLALAPKGDALFLVDATDPKAPKLARVATPAKSVTATVRLPERTTAVRLAPDGKTVYVLAGTDEGGELIAFDSARLTQTRLVSLHCSPADLAVADGKAFVSDSQRGTVTVVDVKGKFTETATWDGFPVNARLAATADGNELYTAVAAGSSPYVEAWQLPPDPQGKPKRTARSLSAAAALRLSPDGSHIVLPNGMAYRTPK